MKDEVYIDPENTPEQNAGNLAALRDLRAHFYRLAAAEPDMLRAVALLARAWTLDDVIRMGEAMERELGERAAEAGRVVELFTGRFYAVREDGWGPNPLRVWDVRRGAIVRTFSTPEAANGFAREREETAAQPSGRLKGWLWQVAEGAAAAGLALLVPRRRRRR